MIKVYREDDWTERHEVGKPDRWLLGFGLHEVAWLYLKAYKLNLKAWHLYPVDRDWALAIDLYTKGEIRANLLRKVVWLRNIYWRYSVMFSRKDHFLPLMIMFKLWKYGVVWPK